MKKTFVKALVRAAFIASCLAFCACKDISVMVDEYNGNCLHERIWGDSSGEVDRDYDETRLIPEESYIVKRSGNLTISLSCVMPCNWYFEYEDENGDMQPVPDPADPGDTYASVYLNTGKIRADNGMFYNTCITIDPTSHALPAGTYTLSAQVWIFGKTYYDSAEVRVED